jgi:hypothetical protein
MAALQPRRPNPHGPVNWLDSLLQEATEHRAVDHTMTTTAATIISLIFSFTSLTFWNRSNIHELAPLVGPPVLCQARFLSVHGRAELWSRWI